MNGTVYASTQPDRLAQWIHHYRRALGEMESLVKEMDKAQVGDLPGDAGVNAETAVDEARRAIASLRSSEPE